MRVHTIEADAFVMQRHDHGVPLGAFVDVYVWTPSDWDEMAARLARRSNRIGAAA